MGKRASRRERDLIVELREVEALSLECRDCYARIEVSSDSRLAEGAACPSCGKPLEEWREVATTFQGLLRAARGSPREVRLRLRLFKRLPR